MCAIMSAMPDAVCHAGSVKVSSGFIIENFGRSIIGCFIPSFCSVSSRVMTALPEPSDPAAGMVRTVARGSADVIFAFWMKKSQKSPSYGTPTHIAFAVSMTEPPPTARRKSTFSLRARSMPSYTFLSVGLGLTPPSSTRSMPAAWRLSVTRSSSPLFFADCPP